MTSAALAALFLFAAACSHNDDSSGGTNASNDATETTAGDNAAVRTTAGGQPCPETLVIQTDWFPEPEHAYLYQLIGIDGDIDASNGTYTGRVQGADFNLEIRAGGPYIDNSSPAQQFYSDTDIFMAYVDTSTAIESYATTPSVAVFANFEVGPQILMWDPDKYDFETFADIGNSGATVLHFGGANYIKYLISKGWVDESNTDGSYTGAPARFITEGDLVQQGFATSEPYTYENDLGDEGWGKPVDFLLIHNSGHDIYQSAVAVRPETIETHTSCLEEFVPLMQQALVDYMNDPEPINIMLDRMVKELDSFWLSSVEKHAWATQQMIDLGLVTDGDNNYLGDMDEARIQRLIDELSPIYKAERVDGFGDNDPPLRPSAIYTNRFLDPSISLGY